MKEKPILLNADMVRAVLDGRKTQTRRIIAPSMRTADVQFELHQQADGSWTPMHTFNEGSFDKTGSERPIKCPFGAVGDRLWVRETFRVHSRATDVATLVYKASEQQSWTQQTHRVPIENCNKPAVVDKWTPSIHMPRWASRITLEITGVRVERLASISNEDAGKEGYPADPAPYGGQMDQWLWFRQLWDGIYPEQSFKVNPWVWVIEFKRVEE